MLLSTAVHGRIINDSHFQRLQGYLSDTHLTFGGQTNQAERYIAPTLLLDPPLSSKVMQEEIFGPILPVITVENIEDTLTFINCRPKPLALYLYTRSTDLEQQILSQTSAGSVCVNDGMMFMTNPALPFGGVGSSGMGNYHGQWGFDTFSHIKSVMKRSNWFDINWRYPPFSLAKLKKLKWIS
ncbi:aldehyde dehydrogenase family protein [Lacimicrobium alkaliphilum]|uniref:Aldehyde dehydrogenase domain-containing protein n=1 Tax=Lacimicrobium alkaliphilum TaxID=1526571 RepID=A0ABQ1RLI3_9ALTE|nr:aldehyde dehydrogenase family protein [Lacimicrobium alkaliphilum]GGD70364.1 hypothetical protein GCM10011357_26820 [Lacimicrobium alkaliphilum]